jgi:hypothetical protein
VLGSVGSVGFIGSGRAARPATFVRPVSSGKPIPRGS